MDKIRLDLHLASQHRHYSRTQIKKLIEEGYVLVDGEKRKPGFILKGGEKIQMVRRAPEIPEAKPEDIPLSILYEDDDLLVINKAPGMVVHPAPGNIQGTIVNAVLHHLSESCGANECHGEPEGRGHLPSDRWRSPRFARDDMLPEGSPPEFQRPGIVHRLDKGTSGVMVIAKTDQALRILSKQFKDRHTKKMYQALVFGKFSPKKGTICLAIGRDTSHRRKISSKTRWAREAVTHYEVIREFEGLSFLHVFPETGRTHQIRVHLSESHHPIVGDTLYGAKSFLSSIKDERKHLFLESITRPLLHAAELKLTHPRTGGPMSFTAPLPRDFQEALEIL